MEFLFPKFCFVSHSAFQSLSNVFTISQQLSMSLLLFLPCFSPSLPSSLSLCIFLPQYLTLSQSLWQQVNYFTELLDLLIMRIAFGV